MSRCFATIRANSTRRINERHGRRWRACLVLCLFAMLTSASVTSADEDDDIAVADPRMANFKLTEQQFDQILFGGGRAVLVVNVVNGVRRAEMVASNSLADFRERLDSSLAAELRAVDSQCSLTAAQKKKLLLAGKGDFHQLASHVADLRLKLTSAPLSRERYSELMIELQSLRLEIQSWQFGENTLLRKTLNNTLTPGQWAGYRTLERERQLRMIDGVLINLASTANIEWAVDSDPNTPITERRQANRKRFIGELLEHATLPRSQNAHLQSIVLLEIGRHENRFKPLLGDESWNKLQAQVLAARQLEPTLRRAGAWPVTPSDDGETKD